ncbi:hypothetical protein EI533_21635 [Pseudomonas donghuensis]|nr:hypothetical protein [Pseudomonas donghuensis]
MKKWIIAVTALISGCSGAPTSDVFYTGPANYDEIDKDPAMAKTKVFVKRGYSCNYKAKTAESGALVALLLPTLVEKTIDYGFDKVKEYNAYLKADVTVKGSALLAYNTLPAAWPPKEDGDLKALKKQQFVDSEITKLTSWYLKQDRKHTNKDESLEKLIDDKKKRFGEQFDKENIAILQASENDLCVLLISGNYKNDAGTKALDDFVNEVGASRENLLAYQAKVPTIESKDKDMPFKGLVGAPSLVYEMHIVVTPDSEVNTFAAVPQNLFYPNSLHKWTTNKPERKLTIITTLGSHIQPIEIQHIKAGGYYDINKLYDYWAMFTAPKDEAFQQISLSISEGPDKMITSDFLDAIETQRDPIKKKAKDYADKKVGNTKDEDK